MQVVKGIATHLSDGDNRYVGTSASNLVYAHKGNDILNGGDGNDDLYGQDGFDELYGGNGDDRLYGGANSDTLIGGAGRDQLHGEDANDYIDGESGDDALYGGGGTDTMIGGEGADLLDGGAGADILQGGNGDDTYYVDAGDIIGGETASGGNDTVVVVAHSSLDYVLAANLENVTLTPTAGVVWTIGNALDNRITGNDDGNFLFGLEGNDKLFGQGGNDYMEGGDGADHLFGGAGNDELAGDEGVDYLDGGDGNDVLAGGDGPDTLVGGAGDDIFVFDLEDLAPAGGRWFGQAGVDSINVGGTLSLDLTALGNDRISGIDSVSLIGLNVIGGTGANTLKLAASDIQAMSDAATLRVDGTAEDQVTALGSWSRGEQVQIGNELYDTYLSVGANLIVDTDVAMVFA